MDFKDFIKDFKNKFSPYCRLGENLDVFETTDLLLSNLIDMLEVINHNEYERIKTTKINVLKNVIEQKDKILSAINRFKKGDISGCHNIIFETYLSEDDGSRKIISYKPIEKYGQMFRLRRSEQKNHTLDKDAMFHIPFTHTYLVKNQRFSLAGTPFLYLGNSAYVCWEELDKPSLDDCNFGIFYLKRQVNMVDLSPPVEIKEIQDLIRLPLIISSTIKITANDFPFKPEYIIPQAILQGIIKVNANKSVNLYLDGIIYLSSKVNDALFLDTNLMFNYVFPALEPNESGICSTLNGIFEWSGAMPLEIISDFQSKIGTEINSGNYDISIYNKIERYLNTKNENLRRVLYSSGA